jgi:hypothetical protein
MSRELKDAVFDALPDLPATVTTTDRAVWLWIANRQSDTVGYAWCSHADIAAATRCTIDWSPRAVANLETHGLLAVERRHGSNNRYRIVIPNRRAERGSTEHMSAALSAVGTAVSAVDYRAERGRNQLDNQLDNQAPDGAEFAHEHNCGHRWRSVSGDCPTCLTEEQSAAS